MNDLADQYKVGTIFNDGNRSVALVAADMESLEWAWNRISNIRAPLDKNRVQPVRIEKGKK